MFNVKTYTLCLLILGVFIMETEAARCCLKYNSREIPCRILKGYSIQGITHSCDIPAIVFHTESGRSICADPTQSWTQKRVSCLKMKAARMKTGNMI